MEEKAIFSKSFLHVQGKIDTFYPHYYSLEQYKAAYAQIAEENGAEKAAEKVVAHAAAAHTVLAFLQQHISPHSTIVIWAMNTAAISC